MAQNSHVEGGTTVLLFGPQALSFSDECFQRLRTAINNNPDNAWVRKIVDELPECTERACEQFPKLRSTPVVTLQNSLKEWLNSDSNSAPVGFDRPPNSLLTPLVVLDQLTQYAQYVQLAHVEIGLGSDIYGPQPRRIETLGFCTGLLTALAVSSSSTRTDFQRYAAVAVRLAALIGALVDAEDAVGKYGVSKTLSTASRSPAQEMELHTILRDFPEAYISVNYDQGRATITTSVRTAERLQERFVDAGITATAIGLRGRFHNPDHLDDVQTLMSLCDATSGLQFPEAANAVMPIHSLSGGNVITKGKLHHIALHEILVEQSQWRQTFDAMSRSSLVHKQSLLVSFGSERCVPPTSIPGIAGKIVHMINLFEAAPRLLALNESAPAYSEDDIAVVGMACKLAGADDVDEFWDLNCRGESQHIEVPAERFTFDTHWRTVDPKRKWYGNFVRDPDAFDHKFFQKSPRECATQDPQQRLFLQSAYQAVEQSGYFNSPNADRNVGVYVGVCAADYEANIACYAPNAFSATGNLKSFIAGKISHYFGWHGPGLTIDTACSASAVAIHQACRAILGGECTAALAGGTNVMTSPIWFQNLAGATFLSPTGACKPFDAKADGYCRGEGIACVFLKKMSSAIKDGDLILGSIRSTGVHQNDNCTPIFVPNEPSLSGLFEHVLDKAGLHPRDISLVEAHGTGTPVGDPAEYESILKVLGGTSVRSTPMPIGSVKGLIGHTECTSGVVALIRVILMLHHGIIPPQASYQSASPRLKASPDHMLEICTKTTAWNATNRHALINNYGASGSNASMIVSQPPKVHDDASCHTGSDSTKHAFWITGLDERSIRDYAGRLKGFLASKPGLGLANLSFNMYRQSNRTLPQGLIFSCSSFQELEMKMNGYANGGKDLTTTTKRPPRPVVLCFGGQISKYIGLDRTFYECTTIFRAHLDRCNLTLMSLGHASFYPMIFEKRDVGDPVRLQTMLFALQYSCAQCWIDCGVKPVAVVGHSFGELTALCVAGILSLKDSLRVVAARAQLIKDLWASDSGAMMAVEGDLERLQALLEQAATTCPEEASATVACHNGPTTFTLAGSTNAIDAVDRCISSAPGLRGKKLNVSNAFHSVLVEPLVADLEKIAADMQFQEPTIHWERATHSRSSPMVGPKFFASHMREPVFASQAFERLHRDFPSAIWLESGSNSTITKMANKALGTPTDSFFTDINITSDSSLQKLTDTFVNLWQEGLTIPHWSHHHTQAHMYSPVFLPPYQFEKARHWLELKKPLQVTEQDEFPPKAQHEELPTTLYTFSSQDDTKSSARFRINTMSKIYNDFVSGHLIVHTAAICPATLEVDIAIEAVLSLHPELVAQSQPEIRNVENQAPICQDPSRLVWLDLQATTSDFRAWNWQIISTNAENAGKMTHVKGQISFRSNEDNAEFARFERLLTHQACTDVLHSSQPDDVLQGRNLYKVFSEIVDYSEPYRGLQKLVGKGNRSAGRVVKAHSGLTWLDPHLSDCFSQVGGFWVNCMTDKAPTDMYIAAGFESWFRRSDNKHDKSTSVWDVMAYHNQTSDRAYTTDIFIFEAATGTLCEVILGIHYARIPKATMSKTLMKLTASTSDEAKLAVPSTQATPTVPTIHPSIPPTKDPAAPVLAPIPAQEPNDAHAVQSKAVATVVEILAELSGVEVDVIKISTRLADIGIDSLVGMEMVHDLDSRFGCSLDLDQMAEVVTVHDVVECVQATLGIQGDIIDNDPGSSSTSGTQSPRSTQSSATSGSDSERVVKSVEDIQLPAPHKVEELQLAASDVFGAFHETKKLTDQFIVNFGCSGYMDTINPKQTQLCIALVVEAFEKLGCNLRMAKAGAVLSRISHAPQHARLAQYLYSLLEKEGRLIDVDGDTIVRTAVSLPQKSSKDLLDHLVAAFPDHGFANRLAFYCGTRLVEVLQGSLDGVKLIFGFEEGRQLVSGLYGDSLLNKIFYKLMEETLSRLVTRLPRNSGPLKILEMGAGTGGTTKYLAPLLAKLGVPVEYTFTDLAPSFVALARRTFKAYPFMKFRAHDIEHEPADDLIGTQHIVIASNAVHATHSLTVSAKNIRKALRPDGFLMMLEMTETLPWVDIIFGLLEGWWLFDDGRLHAISHQSHWERELQAVGYGHVDWTDGQLPENQIQRIIIAMASGAKFDHLPLPAVPMAVPPLESDIAERAATVDAYVAKFTAGFTKPTTMPTPTTADHDRAQCILVTGGTGSLGAHVVADLVARSDVEIVYCLNRASRNDPEQRQLQSLADKELLLAPEQAAKLRIIEAHTSKNKLGLSDDQYRDLARKVTVIIHNAWPMSGVRPIKGFEGQFSVMRNLIDLARDAACSLGPITFQFISSIAVVGHYPLWSGNANVPEERVGIESVLPNGYGDAKYVCERMLDDTLHKYPSHFRTMSVRLGQVAGSRKTGYWNAMEHLSFLIKSSQTLRALPNFSGALSWTPVDCVATTLAELALDNNSGAPDTSSTYPVYHIDNPLRQPWEAMLPVLARALDIPPSNMLPFTEWVRLVRHFSGSVEKDNPAFKLIDFLDGNFLRMSCGGLLLDTKHSREHSPALAAQGPVSAAVAEGYIRYWKRAGFLAGHVAAP